MKKIASIVAFIPFLWACAATPPSAFEPVEQPSDPTMTLRTDRVIPYSENSTVPYKIKNECHTQEKLSHFIQVYGAEHDIAVERVNDLQANAQGQALQVEITDAVSRGNPFLGHRKATDLRGTLYEDGERQASFTATRTSMGGAFAGFKSSCSVLGRTVEALGSDIVTWLQNPIDQAHLGD